LVTGRLRRLADAGVSGVRTITNEKGAMCVTYLLHEGRPYRRVQRGANKGDRYLVYTGSDYFLTFDHVYKVVGFDDQHFPQVIDDENDRVNLDESDYDVLEPLTLPETNPIAVLSVTPPVEKSYTIVISDSILAKIED